MSKFQRASFSGKDKEPVKKGEKHPPRPTIPSKKIIIEGDKKRDKGRDGDTSSGGPRKK